MQVETASVSPSDPSAIARTGLLLAALFLLGGCGTSGSTGPGASFAMALVQAPRDAPYRREVSAAARRYRVPPALLLAIIHAESNFDPHAVSHKGAVGLMQIMPATARWMAPGVSRRQLFDPALNIELGARYLRYLANRYGGDAEKILIAWNAGPGRLDRGRVPGETRVFVRRVHGLYRHYTRV